MKKQEKPILYFDAHAHVQFAAFNEDRDKVIQHSLDAGVGMVNVGTQLRTSQAGIELANRYENVYAAVGKHPIHEGGSIHDPQEIADAESEPSGFDYNVYRELASDPKVVAIGECGLDYATFARDRRERLQKRASAVVSNEGGLPNGEIESRKENQKQLFIQHIKLAHELQKPLMIHCREAYPDLINLLITNHQLLIPIRPGIAHFFSGTKEDARALLELGFYFTFGGVITFTRDYDEIIRTIPIERILSETDAPYVAPVPHRGKRNEPAYVVEVTKKLAGIKNMSEEEMRRKTLHNTAKIFNISIEAVSY